MLELSALTVGGESNMTVDSKNLHEAQRVTDELNKNAAKN